MCYDCITKEIFVNPVTLANDALPYDVTFKAYITIIFCHELGHYVDTTLRGNNDIQNLCRTLLKDKKRPDTYSLFQTIKDHAIKAEENAWELVNRFIPSDLKKEFENIKEMSLKEDKKIFDIEM